MPWHAHLCPITALVDPCLFAFRIVVRILVGYPTGRGGSLYNAPLFVGQLIASIAYLMPRIALNMWPAAFPQ